MAKKKGEREREERKGQPVENWMVGFSSMLGAGTNFLSLGDIYF